MKEFIGKHCSHRCSVSVDHKHSNHMQQHLLICLPVALNNLEGRNRSFPILHNKMKHGIIQMLDKYLKSALSLLHYADLCA